jgi:hypothetical protein
VEAWVCPLPTMARRTSASTDSGNVSKRGRFPAGLLAAPAPPPRGVPSLRTRHGHRDVKAEALSAGKATAGPRRNAARRPTLTAAADCAQRRLLHEEPCMIARVTCCCRHAEGAWIDRLRRGVAWAAHKHDRTSRLCCPACLQLGPRREQEEELGLRPSTCRA